MNRRLFLGAAAAPLAGFAQNPDPDRIILDVFRVNFLLTVSDRKGRFVINLNKEDFEVQEEKKMQNILEFYAESNLPLRLGILIDTSNSIRDRFRFQQEAAVEFVNSVVRPKEDRAIVVSFDNQVELKADLTGDVEKLSNTIRDMRPGGGTALFDAIFYACKDKLMQDQPLFKFRRAMVVLSDGEDTQSIRTREQAIEMALKADVVVYTISTNITRIQSEGDKVLKHISERTGGQTFFPFRASDLTQSFENIANELRSQYNLLYRPEPIKTDGQWHPVQIRVKNRKDLIIRTRPGYFAPKA
ncbi:VWA domain-containing protein [Bryobacter aggregatus]|uniref:VWA domain-containing protein n=1 Tax=Bryobacter aggregatus TaxID=360054 RepID=UPI0009B5CCD1|nr:VWA domain-containing protein [Bryobacter aggregatus]